LTRIFVANAETERPVRKVTELETVTITSVKASPTCPSTQPVRKYMITPRIVKILGVNTPLNVPN